MCEQGQNAIFRPEHLVVIFAIISVIWLLSNHEQWGMVASTFTSHFQAPISESEI